MTNKMGLNQTPSSERVHIGFFGRRNAGKSSVMNAVTGQDLAVVSDVKGTTTDPVSKAMELLPVGPVVMIDTPGIDDEGELGALRVRKSYQILNKTDVAVLVVDGSEGIGRQERKLIQRFEDKKIPYLVAYNKSDQWAEPGENRTNREDQPDRSSQTGERDFAVREDGDTEEIKVAFPVSAKTGQGIRELKEAIAELAKTEEREARIVGDLLAPADLVVLVVPVDKAAPKGRLILPQQQTIRDILDSDAVSIVVKESELKGVLDCLGRKPRMVITDSQAFAQVSRDTPRDIPLTSFSILFARYKGNLDQAVKGAGILEHLQDGDRILMAEGCTHHRQCDDIGTVKLPGWIRKYTGKNLEFVHCSGTEFPEDLSQYGLIVHCGGCMLNEREMQYRLRCAADQGAAITNYGILIAHMNGILRRSLEPFAGCADF